MAIVLVNSETLLVMDVTDQLAGNGRLNIRSSIDGSSMEIPVVDFDGVFSSADLTSCPQTAQIHSALTTVGFVFIKNHGIERKLVRS